MIIKVSVIIVFIILVSMVFLIGSCLLISPAGLIQLTPEEFQKHIDEEDVFLVDVHTPEQTHLEGTDYLIPFNKIKENLEKFPEDKNTPIYLYCKTGHMANVAARTLLEEGYTTVYNMADGMVSWEKWNLSLQ